MVIIMEGKNETKDPISEENLATDSISSPIRVLYCHGAGSGPKKSYKVIALKKAGFKVRCAQMSVSTAADYALQKKELEKFKPDIVVGASYGGGIALRLVAKGHWKGPTILCAPVYGGLCGGDFTLPEEIKMIVWWGKKDSIPLFTMERIVKCASVEGSVELKIVHDGHSLRTIVDDGSLFDAIYMLCDRPKEQID